jgi:hypothetical protein
MFKGGKPPLLTVFVQLWYQVTLQRLWKIMRGLWVLVERLGELKKEGCSRNKIGTLPEISE